MFDFKSFGPMLKSEANLSIPCCWMRGPVAKATGRDLSFYNKSGTNIGPHDEAHGSGCLLAKWTSCLDQSWPNPSETANFMMKNLSAQKFDVIQSFLTHRLDKLY